MAVAFDDPATHVPGMFSVGPDRIYITVADVDASAAACESNGGKLLVKPRGLAGGRFCVIEDPCGSVAALYQP